MLWQLYFLWWPSLGQLQHPPVSYWRNSSAHYLSPGWQTSACLSPLLVSYIPVYKSLTLFRLGLESSFLHLDPCNSGVWHHLQPPHPLMKECRERDPNPHNGGHKPPQQIIWMQLKSKLFKKKKRDRQRHKEKKINQNSHTCQELLQQAWRSAIFE